MLELRVKKLLSKLFSIPLDSINENSSSDNIDKWDSLGHMNLIVALEEEFNISFTDEQILELLSFPLILLTLKEMHVELDAPCK